MQDASVNGCRKQVVGRSDGVSVAGEMKVEILHRHNLRVSTSGRTALDAEGWPLRRLANACEDLLADLVQTLADADCGYRFPFAERGGGDGSHINVLGVGEILDSFQNVEMNLGLVLAVQVQVIFCEAHVLGDLHNGPQFGCLGNLNITGYG